MAASQEGPGREIEREREREIERDRDREIEREKGREREGEREREIWIHIISYYTIIYIYRERER